MKTTRQLILEHLSSKQVASAMEISRALKLTSANIRHHLAILTAEGAVTIIGEKPAIGRGRPASLYALTSQASLHNLDRLASVLLKEIANPDRPEYQIETLQRIAQVLSGDTEQATARLTRRLYQAVQRLNELHYQARWEARSVSPQIILGHCPYAAILPDHPELCRLDALILEALLKTRVEKMAHLARDERGLTYCMFTLDQ